MNDMNQENGTHKFEEFRQIGHAASWGIIVFLSLAILTLGFIIYAAIPDAPRQWDFGILPDTPAESIYSTTQAAVNVTPPPQIPPLPEATPVPGGRP
jgi:hypothetical protein